MYLYIEDVTSFDAVEKPEDFYNSAVAFGNFQRLLADYPAATLHETIPNFHNTVSRLADFKKAVKEDVCGRAKDVQEEIRFVLDRSADCSLICDALGPARSRRHGITAVDLMVARVEEDDQ